LNSEISEPTIHRLVAVDVDIAKLWLLNFELIEGCCFAGLDIIRLHAWLLANIGCCDWQRIKSLTVDKSHSPDLASVDPNWTV
jgi:hypothetical protein